MLITVAEYKQFIGHEGAKEDPRIEEMIKSISPAIEAYLGYKVNLDQETEYILTIKGRDTYFINSTEVDMQKVSYLRRGEKPQELGSDDYFATKDGKIQLFVTWPINDNDKLEITYSQDGQFLDDVKLAAKLLTRFYYKDEYNVQSMNTAGASISYITGKNFPPHVRTLLDLHRVL